MTSARCLIALLIAAAPVAAQQPTPAAVNALLDSLGPAAVASAFVPGAVVAIVRNDSVIALRGFGFARLEDSVRADPARSIYRLASVAKLFVATTVLQRVQAGQLALERDVAQMAPDVPIPGGWSQPITLRHLLTHTAGFDERVIGYAARSRAEMRPLGEYLAERLPDRGWAPGSVVSYSNHGMAFAAYIAERQARFPFAQLANDVMFAPLGMHHTYYIEPRDSALAGDLAPGYRCGPSGCERAPVTWSHAYPVGLAFSTAADMARAMRAWLEHGKIDGQQVLDATVVDGMMQEQFTHDPRVPGNGFAFFQQRNRGHTVVAHAGGVPGTATVLALVPSQGLGVFIATNAGEPTVPRLLLEGLLDALLPDESPPAPVANGPVREYAGNWKLARYSHRTIEAFPAVFAFTTRATAKGDTLLMAAGTRTRRFVRVDSLLLQEVKDGTRLALRRDASGRLTHLFTGMPTGGAELPGAFERASWYEGPYFLNEYASALLGWPILVLMAWALVTLGQWLWRRRRGQPAASRPMDRVAIMAIALSVSAIAAFTWFGFGIVAGGTRDLARSQGMAFGMTGKHIALLRLAWPIAIAAVPIAALAVVAWRRRWWNVFGRTCYSALAIMQLAVAHFLVWFNYVPGRW
jgi:CubicO group peptidase (beta-lactamase class C family)